MAGGPRACRHIFLSESPGVVGASFVGGLRRGNRLPALLAVLFCVYCGRESHAAPSPYSVLDPTWQDAFEYLLTRGALPGVFRGNRPYRRDVVAAALRAAPTGPLSPFERQLVARLLREWDGDADGRLHVRASAQARVRPEHSPRLLPTLQAALRYERAGALTLYQEWAITPAVGGNGTLRGASSATRRTRPWNPGDALPDGGYVADFLRAAARARVAGVDVTVGRQSLQWGPGHTGSLFLSDASPGLDGVSVEGLFGPVWGAALFAALNPMWAEAAGERYLARRYLSAHRVAWRPSDALEVGVADAVLYGGDARPPEWHYLNPLLPFYASQYNASQPGSPDFLDDNAMIAFDGIWSPGAGWSLYGEALVDDFRYGRESDDPNALGWLIGAHRAGWWERGEWRVEYARAGRWLYTHLVPENQYTHFAAPLGYVLGNDADALLASAAWWLSPTARVEIAVRQERKGDSGVDDRFRGERDAGFLKAPAEVRRSLSVGASSSSSEGWRVLGELRVVRTLRPAHETGVSRVRAEARALLAREFATP